MTAREKFRKGDRVQFSEAWLNGSGRGRQRTGVVVGFGRRDYLVGVCLDGTVTRHAFHMDFIERQEASERPSSDDAVGQR